MVIGLGVGRTTTVTSLLFLIAACRSPGAPEAKTLRIEPDRSRYQAGDSVALALTNFGLKTIAYNSCDVSLQRSTFTRWIDEPAASHPCPDNRPHTLQPGSEANWKYELPLAIAPGEYRYVYSGVVAISPGTSGGETRLSPPETASSTFHVR